MAEVTWLLQQNLRDRGFLARLSQTLDDLGAPWRAVPLVPFSNDLPTLPPEMEHGAIVCYGPSFVPRVADLTRWKPGIFFNRDAFRWSAMNEHWRDLMFSSDGRTATLAQVLAELDESTAHAFVRPDADDKAFDGAVFDARSLQRVAETMDRQAAVVIASPRTIDAEWRCFVVGGAVVDSSEYRRAGQPRQYRGAAPRAVELVEQAAARWLPAGVTCIDIASSGDHFGIIEANCFSASRFYAADPGTIVASVTAFARNLAE